MNNKLSFGLILLHLLALSCGRETSQSIHIIPAPAQVQIHSGHFNLNSATGLYYSTENPRVAEIANFCAERLGQATGFRPQLQPVSATMPKNSISLVIDPSLDTLGTEGYQLEIQRDQVRLAAPEPTGLFWAVQTLRQMLPSAIENPQLLAARKWQISAATIVDKPRFRWRGMNLDCGRHFMEKDFIKRYIDLLAYYKMNTFHWHLTEDQGWRIEIQKYPKLTEIGAWREYEDGTRYGGFYTQDDIREVVAYAQSRFINVVPEIELPGHCKAALASYPELSCTGGPFQVETQWGVHKDVYCAGNEKTFVFLQDVLGEVLALFPSPYIHIGGDEVPKDRWQECRKCQKRIQSEGLADAHELQSYFIKRIEKFLNAHGRRLIGWDEILEGGLAPGATVQSWRGVDGGIAAAQSGHDVIMSPSDYTYFNADVGSTDLRKVYEFEPVPPVLNPDHAQFIIGGECNMWTEYAPQEKIDYQMFPRLLAIAEVLWSAPEQRNFTLFHQHLQGHYPRLELLGVNYGPEARPISVLARFDSTTGKFHAELSAGEPGLELRYSLSDPEPNRHSPKYRKPVQFRQTATLSARAFRNGQPYGDIARKEFIDHQAVGKSVHLSQPYSYKYPAGGALALVDGIRGAENFADGCWQGFEEVDLDAIIDLGGSQPIHGIRTGFLQKNNSWIFLPQQVEFGLSDDGKNFTVVASIIPDVSPRAPETIVKTLEIRLEGPSARYLRVLAKNIGHCPAWHYGAGGKAWIFVDEIIVD